MELSSFARARAPSCAGILLPRPRFLTQPPPTPISESIVRDRQDQVMEAAMEAVEAAATATRATTKAVTTAGMARA